MGIPCIAHLRSFNSEGFTHQKATFINQNIHTVLAYSESISEHWIQQGLSRNKVHVIHNGIENIDTKPLNLQHKYQLPETAKTIGIVGRVIPVRNHLFLLQAFKQLHERHENIYLLIIGDGNEEDITPVRNCIEELDLREHVLMIGYYPNAKEIIASLDVLVLPYTIEPFGRTLLEAWQLKTPLVLSRVGFIENIVQHGVNGLLFDPESQDQLAHTLEVALFNELLRHHLINNGLERCKQSFAIQQYVEEVESIYHQVFIQIRGI